MTSLSNQLSLIFTKQQNALQDLIISLQTSLDQKNQFNQHNLDQKQIFNFSIQKISKKQKAALSNFIKNIQHVWNFENFIQDNLNQVDHLQSKNIDFQEYNLNNTEQQQHRNNTKIKSNKQKGTIHTTKKTHNQYRIKDVYSLQKSNPKKHQQLLKISLKATQQHNLRRKIQNQNKLKQTLQVLQNLRNQKNNLRTNQWRTDNKKRLPSLQDKNMDKMSNMRKSIEKSIGKINSKNGDIQCDKIQSPKRKMPYTFYNIYRMYGDNFVLLKTLNNL